MGVPLPHLVLPFFFLPLDLLSIWCVPATWWTGTNVFPVLCLLSCLVSFDRVSHGHVGRRRAHSTMTLTVCVVCA